MHFSTLLLHCILSYTHTHSHTDNNTAFQRRHQCEKSKDWKSATRGRRCRLFSVRPTCPWARCNKQAVCDIDTSFSVTNDPRLLVYVCVCVCVCVIVMSHGVSCVCAYLCLLCIVRCFELLIKSPQQRVLPVRWGQSVVCFSFAPRPSSVELFQEKKQNVFTTHFYAATTSILQIAIHIYFFIVDMELTLFYVVSHEISNLHLSIL